MLDKFFRLTIVRLSLIGAAWLVCVVLHNLIDALFRDSFGPDGDEPVFFLLAVVVIPLYLVVSVVYSGIQFARRRGP